MTAGAVALPQQTLAEIEAMAVEFAEIAGAELLGALGRTLAIRYKGDAASLMDPVSEVDQEVERLIRLRLAATFPLHDIVGEEVEERTGREHDVVWVIDPVDGTTNFVNGFPLFAASIGVLHRGRPVVGAVWCSTGHLLRPAVYHSGAGQGLRCDGEAVTPRRNLAVRRRLAGEPVPSGWDHWDVRQTGSAAIECAFVATGLLEVARLAQPHVWDVGAGLALVQAAGLTAYTRSESGWEPLERIVAPATAEGGAPDLRRWRQPVVIGERQAAERMCGQVG
jgi:myo-inositol-1(or 4)-monophosphatase